MDEGLLAGFQSFIETSARPIKPITSGLHCTPASTMRPPSFTCLRSLTSSRCFSTSTPHFARSNSSAIEHLQSRLPPYPYGSNRWYKQSNFGLYGDRRIQFGNTVSPKTEIKNRRAWRPNIRHQRLWSAALNRFIRVKVLARVLRTIDKVGGLDEYLLGDKASRIRELGLGGWKLRWRITRTEAVMERYRRMREEMRLPPLDER